MQPSTTSSVLFQSSRVYHLPEGYPHAQNQNSPVLKLPIVNRRPGEVDDAIAKPTPTTSNAKPCQREEKRRVILGFAVVQRREREIMWASGMPEGQT